MRPRTATRTCSPVPWAAIPMPSPPSSSATPPGSGADIAGGSTAPSAADVLSIIALRLHAYVLSGRLAVASEAQFWSLVFRIGDRALACLARRSVREWRVVGAGEGPAAGGCSATDRLLIVLGFAAGSPVADVLHSVRRDDDRELLRLGLAGAPTRSSPIGSVFLLPRRASDGNARSQLCETAGGGHERGSRTCRKGQPCSRSRRMVAPSAARRSSRRSYPRSRW